MSGWCFVRKQQFGACSMFTGFVHIFGRVGPELHVV
jgi:hypothetical protein